MKKVWALFLSMVLLLSVTLPVATQVQAATISDVSTKSSRYTAINWAVDQGLMNLYTGNKFDLSGNVSEAQLVSMIGKLDYNYQHSYTTDMLYNYYGDLYMPLAGTYSKAKRNQLVTRGDFAVIYAAMRGLDLSEKHAVQYLYTQEITTGTNGQRTYEGYAPEKNLTRGDAAVFLYRATQKGKIQVDGFTKEPSAKDDKKITLPVNFVEHEGEAVEIKPGTPGENDVSANQQQAIKAVQSVAVDKQKLIANGRDYTKVSVKLKDSQGKAIPYTKSLKFRVTSQYYDWECNCYETTQENSSKGLLADGSSSQVATAVTAPYGPATDYIFSDGPDVTLFFQAPKATKSLKDHIILELVDETSANYATYRGQQIKIPIEYIPQPELRVSYEVFDATIGEYVGGGGNEQAGTASPIPGVAQGPMIVKAIDLDKKQFTRQVFSVDEPFPQVPYEHAYVSLAGYKITEQIFERIIEGYLDEGGRELTLQYTVDANGFPMYDLPYAVIPNSYASQFAGESQSYAVLMYLIDLLPSSISDFSMAYYDSVKTAESIARTIPANMFNVAPLSNYRGKVNGLYALAELADQTLLDELAASRPENMPSYTKFAVELYAPGGQKITNYKGQVEITYNGQTVVEPFSAGQAIKYFEGLKYGNGEVSVKLVNLNQDTRYKKILAGLDKEPTTKEVHVVTPINEMVCAPDMEVVFLVDNSGSMNGADPTNILNDRVANLVKSVGSDPSTAASFTTGTKIHYTNNAKIVSGQIAGISQPYDASQRSGGTAFKQAINKALNSYESSFDDRNVKRLLFVISDGKTNESITSILKNIKGVEIHTVALGDANKAKLKELAEATGGQYHYLSSTKNTNAVFNLMLQSLCGGKSSCPDLDGFETAEVTILPKKSRDSLFIEAKAYCEDVAYISVTFYSVDGNFELDLKYIGENMFELEYALNKIKNFNIYEEVEFVAFNEGGKKLTTQRVDIQ